MYYWCGKRQVGHEGYACKDLTWVAPQITKGRISISGFHVG